MFRRGAGACAVVLALAAGGCGGDDEESESPVVPPGVGFVQCLPRPDDDGPITVRPRWSAGEVRKMIVERHVEDSELDAPVRASANGEIRVLRTGSGRSSLRYSTGTYFSQAVAGIPAEVARRLEREIPGLVVEYATAPNGTFIELLNRPALQQAAVQELTERLGDPTLDPILLHDPYGLVLEPGERVRTETLMAGQGGGDAVSAIETHELVSAKRRNGCALIEATLVPDAAELRRSTVEALPQLAPGQRVDPSAYDDLRERVEMRYEYDPVSGWMMRAERTRRVAYGDRRRTERVVIGLR